ncbi:MAG TPA: hypothetical protein VGJ84_06360, partial [Polyangiaceae bacterium]
GAQSVSGGATGTGAVASDASVGGSAGEANKLQSFYACALRAGMVVRPSWLWILAALLAGATRRGIRRRR